MKTMYYHESFEYEEKYDFEKLLKTGISANSKIIVCPTCNGHGSHFRTDLDENLLLDEINEDCDEDSMEAYQNEAFNQVCTECNGRNVVDDILWSSLPKWAQISVEEWEAEKRLDEQIRRAELGYY